MAKYKIIPSSRTIVQSPISIGHKAEKGVRAIEFDLTAWVETYGSGTATVIMRRWGDAIPYPIALEIDENNKATWTLSDTDTAKAGMAYAQLSYIVGDEVVKKSDIYTFRVIDSLTGEGEPPEAYESWLEHLTHLAAEAMAEVLDIEGIVTDKTLTVDGGVADAKKTGDELSQLEADLEDLDDRVDALEEGGGSGLTDAVKTALLQLAQRVAYIDDDGQDYYDDLYDALYPPAPPASLTSITAVYTQSGTVYDTDSLNGLKSDLVVTAHYSDSTSHAVTDYTLSGTLAVGTSVIAVTYNDKSTTFNVTVTAIPYSFHEGTYSGDSSYTGFEVEVSGGHFHVTSTAGNKSRSLFVDEDSFGKTIQSGTMFSLSAGDEYEFKIKNIVFASNSSASNAFTCTFRNPSDTNVCSVTVPYTETTGGTLPDVSSTGTIDTSTDVTCLKLVTPYSCEYEFDFEFWVNGERWI